MLCADIDAIGGDLFWWKGILNIEKEIEKQYFSFTSTFTLLRVWCHGEIFGEKVKSRKIICDDRVIRRI